MVRFRHNNDGSGYPRQDLDGRKPSGTSWPPWSARPVTLSNVTKVTELINILNEYVDTNMPLNDMIYFATAAIGMDLDAALKTGTLPGEWISPYYELDDEGVLELVNELLPVYTQPITEDILNIRHR